MAAPDTLNSFLIIFSGAAGIATLKKTQARGEEEVIEEVVQHLLILFERQPTPHPMITTDMALRARVRPC